MCAWKRRGKKTDKIKWIMCGIRLHTHKLCRLKPLYIIWQFYLLVMESRERQRDCSVTPLWHMSKALLSHTWRSRYMYTQGGEVTGDGTMAGGKGTCQRFHFGDFQQEAFHGAATEIAWMWTDTHTFIYRSITIGCLLQGNGWDIQAWINLQASFMLTFTLWHKIFHQTTNLKY